MNALNDPNKFVALALIQSILYIGSKFSAMITPYISQVFFCLLALCYCHSLVAQDDIYLKGGESLHVDITAEDENQMFYTATAGGKTRKLKKTKVLMVFRDHGTWEVFRYGRSRIIQPQAETDYILTYSRNLIPVKDGRISTPRDSILAILFWNGVHAFFDESEAVSHTLFFAKLKELPPEPESPSQLPSAPQPISRPQSQGGYVAPIGDTLTPINTSSPVTLDKPPALPIARGEFEQKTKKRVEEFEGNVQRLMDRNIDPREVDRIKTQTQTLFIYDTCVIQVSNKYNSTIREYRVIEYLDRITRLPYSEIDVKWAIVNLVGDLRKGEDDLWYGTITFQQRFRGMIEGQVKYEDITTKKMTIVLKLLKETINGQMISQWEVFLSDILVESTN